MEMDFGDGIVISSDTGNDTVDNNKDVDVKDDIDNVNPEDKDKDIDNIDDADKDKKDDIKDNETKDENTLKEGSIIELGEDKYTVDKNGNLLDKDGNIFKEAKDVKEWIDSYDQIGDSDDLTIDNIQTALGITITDENNNPVQFENSIEGIKSYVNAIIEHNKEENYQTAIDALYDKYPIIGDVINYYVANGNSLKGFNEIPDRSNITIEENNEEQQEAIIRSAWVEQNRKGDVNKYIQYLKSSGLLYETAQDELKGLQEADKQTREAMEQRAAEVEEERIKELETYWNNVKSTIDNKVIAGYKIPDNIVINRDGKKMTVTPKDFFNYLYLVDKNGESAYAKDLKNEKPEDKLNDQILRAYLKFTGGNYASLVSMAINKEKVDEIKLKAKVNKTKGIKITQPKNDKKEIDFGI